MKPVSPSSSPAAAPADAAAPQRFSLRDPEEELLQLLRAGQMLLVKYPVAARAAVRAFESEGRRFAQTDEGRRWKEALAGSSLVQRGRLVWEGCSLNVLEEDDPRTVMPSALLEAVLGAVARADLEPLLSRLFLDKDNQKRDPENNTENNRENHPMNDPGSDRENDLGK